MRTETRLPTPSLSRLIQHTLLLCLALALPTSWAQKRVALLVGNSQYQHESVLANPVNDVRLLAKVLRAAPLNFKVEVLENQDRREMDLAIKRFVRESTGADTALLYYAGHGAQPTKGGRSYLLPVNAKAVDDDSLEADGILAESIASQLEQLANPAKLRLVVLDACRNTRLTSSSRSSVRGLAPPARTDSYTLIAYSTDANSVAQDGVGGVNSPYAKALAQHLPRVAQEPVRVIFEDTAKDVRTATRQAQAPRTYGDLESRVGLDGVQVASLRVERNTVVDSGPSVAQIEAQAWEAARRANTIAAYNAYLREYPNGSYAGAARVALASLEPAPVPQPRPVEPPRPAQTVQPAQASAGQTIKDCVDCPELVVVPAGTFQMGSNEIDSAKPVHSVSVKSFAIGKYEVTQGQWMSVMGSNPSNFKVCGGNCPVENVSWDDIQFFIYKLHQKTGQNYRLPTEAEWEYACRGGKQQTYCGSEEINAVGWYDKSSGDMTHPVGRKAANGFGLYDMSGNVWEWVQDGWHNNYQGAPTDGREWTAGGRSARVLRGGSWSYGATDARAANRSSISPGDRYYSNGFRLARTVP